MQCNVSSPHGPHIWYSPNPDPKKTTQVQHSCDGVKAPGDDSGKKKRR